MAVRIELAVFDVTLASRCLGDVPVEAASSLVSLARPNSDVFLENVCPISRAVANGFASRFHETLSRSWGTCSHAGWLRPAQIHG